MEKMKIDNFDRVQSLLTFNDADDFYYIVVIRKGKDNDYDESPYREIVPGRHDEGRYIAGFIINSYEDVLTYSEDIVSLCEENNARAYLTINAKNMSVVDGESMSTSEYLCEPGFMVASFTARTEDEEHYPRTLLDVNFSDGEGLDELDGLIVNSGIEPIFVTYTPGGGRQFVFSDRSVCELDLSRFEKYGVDAVRTMPDEMTILYANLK